MRRPGEGSTLPYSILDISGSRPLRYYCRLLRVAIKNYEVHTNCLDMTKRLKCTTSAETKGDALNFLHEFMDRLEINGPTMHLWFFAYVTLDLKVLKKKG